MKKALWILMIAVILVCSGCGLSKYSAEKFIVTQQYFGRGNFAPG